jgi:hypothetical protein
MSDIRVDHLLDIREQINRIDRSIAETEKLQAETRKFTAEQQKLISESRKLDRDRWLAPALAIVSAIGGLFGTGSFIAALLHAAAH